MAPDVAPRSYLRRYRVTPRPANSLDDILGHLFAQPELLERALTHSSTGGAAPNYERLEFLGDRVLGLVIARMLYDDFADEAEGALSSRFTNLVRRDALARIAEDIGLGPRLILSVGEEQAGGRANPAMLADACEAVIAALYVDGGLEAAERFIHRHWRRLIDEDVVPPQDAKTALQEWAQGRGLGLPEYRETGRSGPDHAPVFTIQVSVAGRDPASAEGSSKRAAEQAAAEILLARIGADED